MPGPGARQPVVAVPRQAPIYSLLDAATIVPPDPDESAVRGGKWLNGIKYRLEPCGVAGALGVGCKTSDSSNYVHGEDFGVDPNSDEIHTDPFLVWAADTCSTFGWEANDYIGRARRLLAASEAYAVEKEFWTGTQAKAAIAAGVAYPNDQWLAQTVSSTTLTAANMSVAVGELQRALGDCVGGGPGVIHVPPQALNNLLISQIVTPIGPNGSAPTGFVDARGNKVVPGFGYSANTSPAGMAAASGHAWLYATGPIRIYRDDPIVYPSTYAQAVARGTNDVTFRVERNYLVDWDRCCHFAVDATYETP